MKPKNLTVSNLCVAIARENRMKVEDITLQVSSLLVSTHDTDSLNKLNAIYDSYQYSKPTKNGYSKINNSGKPFTNDDRINYINGYIDMNDSINEYCINDEYAEDITKVLALASQKELVGKYGTREYKNPLNKYIVGLKAGYKAYKKTRK